MYTSRKAYPLPSGQRNRNERMRAQDRAYQNAVIAAHPEIRQGMAPANPDTRPRFMLPHLTVPTGRGQSSIEG